MIGPLVNCGSILAGGVSGALLRNRIGQDLARRMPMCFGVASIGLGISMVVKVRYAPAAILALLVGTLAGELLHLEAAIERLAGRARCLVERLAPPSGAGADPRDFLEKYVALIVLFCASGTGVFGAMKEGFDGDTSLLVVKSFLDFFTAAIFATTLGYSVAAIAVPQLAVQAVLFLLASLVMPALSPSMIADFSAVGGLIMVATGLRIAGIKPFAVANMVPALFLAMPLSALWGRVFGG